MTVIYLWSFSVVLAKDTNGSSSLSSSSVQSYVVENGSTGGPSRNDTSPSSCRAIVRTHLVWSERQTDKGMEKGNQHSTFGRVRIADVLRSWINTLAYPRSLSQTSPCPRNETRTGPMSQASLWLVLLPHTHCTRIAQRTTKEGASGPALPVIVVEKDKEEKEIFKYVIFSYSQDSPSHRYTY